jgi:hypothetical protein
VLDISTNKLIFNRDVIVDENSNIFQCKSYLTNAGVQFETSNSTKVQGKPQSSISGAHVEHNDEEDEITHKKWEWTMRRHLSEK